MRSGPTLPFLSAPLRGVFCTPAPLRCWTPKRVKRYSRRKWGCDQESERPRVEKPSRGLEPLIPSRRVRPNAGISLFEYARLPTDAHVQQGLAGYVAAQLLTGETVSTIPPARHRAGDVRGDDEVRRLPERMLGRKRLGIGDGERGADVSRAQSVDERVRVDDGAARRVDQKRTLFHPGEEVRVDDSLRLRGEREEQNDRVGLGEQAGKRLRSLGIVPCMSGDADRVHPKRRQARGHRATDRAMAEDEDGRTVEVVDPADRRRARADPVARVAIPLRPLLELVELRQVPAQSEQHRHHPVSYTHLT